MNDEYELQYFNNIQFIINNNGFPLDEISFNKMIEFSKYLNEDNRNQIDAIVENAKSKQRKYPDLPKLAISKVTVGLKVEMIQNYMRKLQYNYTGTQFFCIKSHRCIKGLMEDAREMIRNSLPIKCLEAVILGIYLSNGIGHMERFTVSFRSSFGGNMYSHVVLGVYHSGMYGALGMSRRQELMYKPLKHTSLSGLVLSFVESYSQIGHKLRRISIGEVISHDPCSLVRIRWKGLVVSPRNCTQSDFKEVIEKYSKKLRKQACSYNAALHAYTSVLPLSGGAGADSRSPGSAYGQHVGASATNLYSLRHQDNKASTIIYFSRSRSSLSRGSANRSQSLGPIRV